MWSDDGRGRGQSSGPVARGVGRVSDLSLCSPLSDSVPSDGAETQARAGCLRLEREVA